MRKCTICQSEFEPKERGFGVYWCPTHVTEKMAEYRAKRRLKPDFQDAERERREQQRRIYAAGRAALKAQP